MRSKLNLGAFVNPIHDHWNVDIKDWSEWIDQIVDLTVLPWPWKDESFEEVRAADVLEHLGGATKFDLVAELARVTKRGGTVCVRVPNMFHPTGLACLQHAHAFYITSFDESYSQPWFTLEKVETDLGLPYRFPFRALTRLLLRLGFIECMTFTLRRRLVDETLYESGDSK